MEYPKPTPKEKRPLRTCKNCKGKFERIFPNQICCSIPCAIEYNAKLKKKQSDKNHRDWKKKMKEKSKTAGQWKKDLQDVINWIARKLDENRPCISHPEMNDNTYDAGHYYTVAAHGSIRYNLHNIHKQCKRANKEHGGCPEYAQGLINRYGAEYFYMVLNLPKKYKMYGKKFTIKNIRDEYLPNARRVKRELQAGAELTRDQINEMIGIYD